jgi:hypothetical protein
MNIKNLIKGLGIIYKFDKEPYIELINNEFIIYSKAFHHNHKYGKYYDLIINKYKWVNVEESNDETTDIYKYVIK